MPALRVAAAGDPGQVENRATRPRDRDTVHHRQLVCRERRVVHLDRRARPYGPWHGHLDASTGVAAHPPERGCRPVAEDGVGSRANSAANQRPSRETLGWPTAYTPRCRGCRRPDASRLPIARRPMPSAASCTRATTPCWRSARPAMTPSIPRHCSSAPLWGRSAVASFIRPMLTPKSRPQEGATVTASRRLCADYRIGLGVPGACEGPRQPTVSGALSMLESTSGAPSVTTTRSSMRTPKRPGR